MVEGSLRQQLAEALGCFNPGGCGRRQDDLDTLAPVVASWLAAARQETAQRCLGAVNQLVSPQLSGIDRTQQLIRDGAYSDAVHAAYRAVFEVSAALARETGEQQ